MNTWPTLIVTESLLVSYQASSGETLGSAVPDDGCPCHFSFISVDTPNLEVTCQVFFRHMAAPKARALVHSFLVLRPPLSL